VVVEGEGEGKEKEGREMLLVSINLHKFKLSALRVAAREIGGEACGMLLACQQGDTWQHITRKQ